MIEEDFYYHLQDLEIDIFPQKSPDGSPLPYLIYTVVTGQARGSPSEEVRDIKTSWQIDVYESSAYKAKLLRERVVESIRDFQLQSGTIDWRDGYEPRIKTFRQIIEFRTKQYIGECNGN